MKRATFYLPTNQIQRLRTVANGRPISELIRASIEEYLRRFEQGKGAE